MVELFIVNEPPHETSLSYLGVSLVAEASPPVSTMFSSVVSPANKAVVSPVAAFIVTVGSIPSAPFSFIGFVTTDDNSVSLRTVTVAPLVALAIASSRDVYFSPFTSATSVSPGSPPGSSPTLVRVILSM